MRLNPIDNRDALAKLPRITQRFWTWLTGLTHRDEPVRQPWTVNQHLFAYVCVFAMGAGITGWATQSLYNVALSTLS
jgi:hypothetical protein